jgi:hypothetical protein
MNIADGVDASALQKSYAPSLPFWQRLEDPDTNGMSNP